MKKINTQSFWIKKKNDSYIKNHNIDLPNGKELLIKTVYSGISYGTEKIVYAGSVPKSQKELMRCPYQEGSFGSDVKYGYMNIGMVMDGSPDFKGKYVYTLFPHQKDYVLDESEVTLIPESIPLKRCLLTANMETVINGMWDTLPSCGDKILVVGSGVVGFLMAYLLKTIPGCEILLVDSDAKKSKFSKLFDINFKTTIPRNYKANIIYECSGNADIINSLSKHVMDEATICILSWYGDNTSKVKFGEEFLSKRIKFIFSQVSKVSHNRNKYWDNIKRRELAISMLNDDRLDHLIEQKMIDFSKLPTFFSKTVKDKGFFCKVVNYGSI